LREYLLTANRLSLIARFKFAALQWVSKFSFLNSVFLRFENSVDARFDRTPLAGIVDVDPEPVSQGIEDRGRAVQKDFFGSPIPVDG
jgi:hypothetical protein